VNQSKYCGGTMGTNYIDSLLASIQDESVRERLTKEVKKLRDNKEFGLVFERHIPEYVRLPKHKITEGATVQIRAGKGDEIYVVRSLGKKKATIIDSNDEAKTMATKDLITVSRHGDPIFPGLTEVGRVERGGGKPFHTVINAENYHALQLLLHTHEGKVDCIYIDPPYNSGAKDWKYNNDYVDSEDSFRHSKWLSFMEKRLNLAKRLLKPENSILIVTIDEKEYLRLGLLLEQIFPRCNIQMVSSVISAKGTARTKEFSRVGEYIFYVLLGKATINRVPSNLLDLNAAEISGEEVAWLLLRRREPSSIRAARPNQFYPIFISQKNGSLHSIGDAITQEVDKETVKSPKGTFPVWPLNSKGKEMLWGLTPEIARGNWEKGYLRAVNWKKETSKISIKYLPGGTIDRIEKGITEVRGKYADGSVKAFIGKETVGSIPKSIWNMESHNAESHGTKLISKLLPDKRFDYPKSLYAVEDTLRIAINDNKNAVVLDFFAGSGTTNHSVMRLNKQDHGSRMTISVTNNEISLVEQKEFASKGITDANEEWINSGIFYSITKPRLEAAVNGVNKKGEEIKGKYLFTDVFPLAKGFEENIRFVTLDYLDNDNVIRNKSFDSISTILWMISGSVGSVIEEVSETFELQPEGRYGILFDITYWQEFVDAVKEVPTMTHVFIITDSKVQYQQIVNHLPTNIYATMLYEDYLRNFQIGV
jgi:adenine-specific DNA-methyltransferase